MWEHKHIATEGLPNTFWTLLGLGAIPNANVLESWAGTNYDYFWIIDYTGPQPTFTVVQQDYTDAAYAHVPTMHGARRSIRASFRISTRIASSNSLTLDRRVRTRRA